MPRRPRDPAKVRDRGHGQQGCWAGCWPGCPTLVSPCLPASSVTTFTGEPNMCPRCGKRVYFGKAASGHRAVRGLHRHPGVCGVSEGGLGSVCTEVRSLWGVLAAPCVLVTCGGDRPCLSPLQPRR